MKNPDKKNGGFVDRIVFMGIALLLLGGFAVAQIAVRYDPATDALTEPVAADFYATNQPPLSSLTNALENWTGNTNLATAAQGAKADTAVQPGNNITTLTNNIGYITSAEAPVQSVAGRNGTVVLTKTDVGLSNVDNTSDAAKPISTATQLALDEKADAHRTLTAGTGLSGGGDLSANRTISLADTSVAAGVYGGDNATLSITVDAQGRLTAAANKTITPSGIGAAQLVGDNAFTGNQSVTGNLTVNGTSTFNGDGTLGGNWTYKGVPMVVGSYNVPGRAATADWADSADWANSAGSADWASSAGLAGSAGYAQELSDANSYYTALMRSSGVWSGDLSGLTLALDAATANRTIPGNLTVNGSTTLGDAAGDSVTVNAGSFTAPNATITSTGSVANVGVLDARYIAGNPLNLGRGVWNLSSAEGSTTLVGSASGTPTAKSWRMLTGTTSESSCFWNAATLARYAKNGNSSGVQFSRPVWLIYAGQIQLGANGIFRIQLAQLYNASAISDLSPASNSHGMGFYLSGGEIKLETCNTTTRTLSSSLGSYSTGGAVWIDLKARSDGMGNVRVWINGTEVASQTGGPTIDTASSISSIVMNLTNAGDSASYFADIVNSQITVIVE